MKEHGIYKWDNRDGVCDENGKQLIQLCAVNCSKKFRAMAGKELVKNLNTIQTAAKQPA